MHVCWERTIEGAHKCDIHNLSTHNCRSLLLQLWIDDYKTRIRMYILYMYKYMYGETLKLWNRKTTFRPKFLYSNWPMNMKYSNCVVYTSPFDLISWFYGYTSKTICFMTALNTHTNAEMSSSYSRVLWISLYICMRTDVCIDQGAGVQIDMQILIRNDLKQLQYTRYLLNKYIILINIYCWETRQMKF